MGQPGPRITLEQWRALVAVVDAGGYAQAAEQMHKTQSSVTYAVQKIQSLLGVQLFELRGRRAVLTPQGKVLVRRGRALIGEAARVEQAAARLGAGCEAEIGIGAEALFPTWLMLQCVGQFAAEQPNTRLELYESVLGGSEELLLQRRVDLAITSIVPAGFASDHLMTVRFIPVAAPQHPLHALGRELSLEDLRQHRQIVLRDSGSQRQRSAGWLGAEQRLTVGHKTAVIRALTLGLGFAWQSELIIHDELHSGALKPLPMSEAAERYASLYLVLADGDVAGPGTRRIAELIRAAAAELPARCPAVVAG